MTRRTATGRNVARAKKLAPAPAEISETAVARAKKKQTVTLGVKEHGQERTDFLN